MYLIEKFQMKLKETIEAALLFQPHVVVTVDNKGFSFRLLKRLKGNINPPLFWGHSKVFLMEKWVNMLWGIEGMFCS